MLFSGRMGSVIKSSDRGQVVDDFDSALSREFKFNQGNDSAESLEKIEAPAEDQLKNIIAEDSDPEEEADEPPGEWDDAQEILEIKKELSQ